MSNVIEAGLVLDGYRSLSAVLEPLADVLSRCFILIDEQGGPFDSSWMWASPENEAIVDRQVWDVPAFHNRSTTGWRPGTLPQLADYILIDEWTWFFVIDALEEPALVRASALRPHAGFSVLRELDRVADMVFWHADGWWEFYTGRLEWYERMRAAWPDCITRPLEHAGTPP